MADLEFQLTQLYEALAVADEEDKPGLIQIIEELKALIDSDLDSSSTSHVNTRDHQTELNQDDEFFKFQEELRNLDSSTSIDAISSHSREAAEQIDTEGITDINTNDEGSNSKLDSDLSINIQAELNSLIGMKCKAPHEHLWGQIGYHNGMIFSLEPMNLENEICVRVIFTQPLSERMRPCSYFLSGTCKFEETCKFSHGEVVPLSHLKDYKEPNFSSLAAGSRVLAKYTDDLWYRAVISQITESSECEVSYENYPEKVMIPLHDAQPLYDDEKEEPLSSGGSSDSESDEEGEDSNEEKPMLWVHMAGTSALGLWEQHTRGMGSKLMAKMGYIFGSGLGKNAEGRVEPVDAVILPPGRSLDTVMKLKEKVGGESSNLFSAERHLKRLHRQEKQKTAKIEDREKQSQSMFNFLNDQLNLRKESRLQFHLSATNHAHPNKDSCIVLKKKLVTVGDEIRQVTRDISKCKSAVKRHEGRDQTTVDLMKLKLSQLEIRLLELKNSEVKINSEQRHRSDKKKLTIF